MVAGKRQLNLFGERIERLKPEVVRDGPLLSPHTSSHHACFAQSDDGRRWVRKRVRYTGHASLLAEILGWLLAEELDVPVPHGAVTGTGEDLSWLSQVVPNTQSWNRDSRDYVQNYDELGRMLALDAIAYNKDRHEGNVLLEPRPTDIHVYAYSIDLGESLLGSPRELEAAKLTTPEISVTLEDLPLYLVREGALAAAEAARQIRRGLLENFAKEACAISGESELERLVGALLLRTQNAPRLTVEYLGKIEKAQ